MGSYCELLVTSNFSFLRGASHPEEYAEQAAALGYQAIGLADINTVAGVVRGHVAAKQHGIKLLVGSHLVFLAETTSGLPQIDPAQVYKTPRRGAEDDPILLEAIPSSHSWLPVSLVVYPQDKKSYGRMCRLLTNGKIRAPKGECMLSLDDLEQHNEGLIGIAVLQDRNDPRVERILRRVKAIFSAERLSIAAARSYCAEGTAQFEAALELSAHLNIPAVAVNNVYYHHPDRRMLQDVLTCIRLQTTIDRAGFALQQNSERHLKSELEIKRLFSKHPALLARSLQIYQQVKDFSLDQLTYEYPHEVCPEGETPFEYLCRLTREGAVDKFPPHRFPDGLPEKIRQQIRHELRLIRELKYEKYFLTCYDIVKFARARGILCQGRGAAANSAVCYCLGITSVDPDQINLLFERFISKERNEPPDIDIDFEHERREEVIQYIYNRFGRMRAALVCEVVSYRTKSSIRDTAKALGFSLETVELILKSAIRADDALPTDVELRHYQLDPEDKRIKLTLLLADTLRSFPRHLSQHTGGFVISEQDLCELVPIENAAMADRSVIEWDKDDIDRIGMMKIDCLALGMLTCIRKAFDLVNQRTNLPADLLKLHSIPADDPAVYDMLCRADSIGVFQIESRAQMTMLPRLRPRCFYDLVIEVAIVRPGPIQGGMVHPFLRRRNNEEQVTYPDKRIEQILSRTLGVPIFQEQVMELAVTGAGFTPGESDRLRRAIASWRKDKKALERFRTRILEGMRSNGYRHDFALQLFEQIKGFGEYGFPQSHAASFALLVYVSSWLKHYHPAAFAAALINSQPMGFYQPAQLIDDAKRHGVEVRPIDINHSTWDCTLEYDHEEYGVTSAALRLGFRLIRSLRKEEGELIAETVKRCGRFLNLREFWKTSGCLVSSLRCLARGDAFRSLGLTRQQAIWETARLRDGDLPLFEQQKSGSSEYPAAEYGATKYGPKDRSVEQDEPETSLPPISLPAQVVRDYQITGFSLKAHPISFLRGALERLGVTTAAGLKDERTMPAGYRVSIAGVVLVRQRPHTARGTMFMTIEDETGMANLIIRETIIKLFRDTIYDSTMVLATGPVQRQRSVVHVTIDEIQQIRYGGLYDIGVKSHDFR